MMTRYNFGAARDPEMLHKIYIAEPVAPIIENPHRDTTHLYQSCQINIIELMLMLLFERRTRIKERVTGYDLNVEQ